MSRSTQLVIAAALLGLVAAAKSVTGVLDPPGAPAPTVAVLEGRIPINSLPITISEPGSYVVVQDLTLGAISIPGITITTSDVTIDLNGFTLRGPGNDVGGGGTGIISGDLDNIAVFNGVVRDFRSSGVFLDGTNHQVTRVRVFDNGGNGINLGVGSTVAECTVLSNGGVGIAVGGGSVVRNNTVSFNATNGIFTFNSLVIGNSSTINGTNINAVNSTVMNNHAP